MGKLRFISHARQWIAFLGRLHQPGVSRPLYTHMSEEFSDYMPEEEGLSKVTVHKRRQHVTQFLSRFDEQHRPFNEISILDIDAVIARKGEHNAYSRSSMRTYQRFTSFLRLRRAAWLVCSRSGGGLYPHAFSPMNSYQKAHREDVRPLLASTEGDNATDMAVIDNDRTNLLLRLGYCLKCSEQV